MLTPNEQLAFDHVERIASLAAARLVCPPGRELDHYIEAQVHVAVRFGSPNYNRVNNDG
ncbi:hypothetical protein [Novipirellula artificiosorum]|uniref:hypothetical protein n=1 Tax=Novipirellula artificiosorum TaxID=2528016 RepID=UPI0018CEBE55|nr:hypothetical protein [Novipirellula artificiosorum]